MTRARVTLLLSACFAASALFTACGPLPVSPGNAASAVKATAFSGSVHGGQPPVSFATIQLYAVGTTSDGSVPTALLTPAAISDVNGNYQITTPYTCPTPSTLVYAVATGGNPGLTVGTNNTAINLISALGACGSLSSSSFATIDEVTTVAAAAALAPYITLPHNIGSGSNDLAALQAAFTLAIQYANPITGISPGVGQNSDPVNYQTIPVTQINSLANALVPCVNSTGSTAAGTPCAMLYALTGSPADIFSAAVNVELNPASYNATSIYNLSTTNPAFQPALTGAPTTFAIAPTPPTASNGAYGTNPSIVSVGSTVTILRSAVSGNCTFTAIYGVSFGGQAASGSFTSTAITATVPFGVPLGLVNGTVQNASGTCTFAVYVVRGSTYTLSPASVSFPNQIVLSQSVPTPVTFTNTNTFSIQVTGATAVGGNTADFPVTANTCTSAPLAPGNACTISVAFMPQALGSRTSSLVVYVNGAAGATTVGLSGSGI